MMSVCFYIRTPYVCGHTCRLRVDGLQLFLLNTFYKAMCATTKLNNDFVHSAHSRCWFKFTLFHLSHYITEKPEIQHTMNIQCTPDIQLSSVVQRCNKLYSGGNHKYMPELNVYRKKKNRISVNST